MLSSRACAQGAALEELLALFPAVLASSGTNVSFDSLLSSLLAAGVAAETGKAAQHSVAQCLARMTIAAGSNHISAVVKGLLGQVQVRTSPHLNSNLDGTWSVQQPRRMRCCIDSQGDTASSIGRASVKHSLHKFYCC